MKTDVSGRLKNLFFAKSDSVKLARRFNSVLLLDCTYKTNKYRMPYLNIIAVSACYSTISVGHAFLSSEVQENYIWAIEQVKRLYNQVSNI